MTTAPSAAGSTKHAAVNATMVGREARVEATTRRQVADFSNSHDWRGGAGTRQARAELPSPNAPHGTARSEAGRQRSAERATRAERRSERTMAARARYAGRQQGGHLWSGRAGAKRVLLRRSARAVLHRRAAEARLAQRPCNGLGGRAVQARTRQVVSSGVFARRTTGRQQSFQRSRCSPCSAPCGRAPRRAAAARGRRLQLPRARCVASPPHAASARPQLSQRRTAVRPRACTPLRVAHALNSPRPSAAAPRRLVTTCGLPIIGGIPVIGPLLSSPLVTVAWAVGGFKLFTGFSKTTYTDALLPKLALCALWCVPA